MRIVQLSDTHISHRGGTPSENFSLLAGYLNTEIRPDLVINTGDVVIFNPDPAKDTARVPGSPRAWGADRFFMPGSAAAGSADWAFIGINSERMSSGLPEQDEQWEWLTSVAGQVRGKSVM